MRYITADTKRPILLGRKGENGVTTVRFPINLFFPDIEDATYILVHSRQGDPAPYPCVTQVVDGVIEWVVGLADVDKPGAGSLQLTAYLPGEVVGKSVVLTTQVYPSLSEEGEAPDAYQTWLDAFGTYVSRIEHDIDAADTAITRYPKIVNGYWQTWDVDAGRWVNTGVKATTGFLGVFNTERDIPSTAKDDDVCIVVYDPFWGDYTLRKCTSSVFWQWEILGSIKGPKGANGFSPIVDVEEIEGGHRVTITDAVGDHVFDVMDGSDPSTGGIVVTDSQGNSWYIPKGEGSGDDPVILDEDGVAWHLLPGTGGEDDIAVTDGDGNDWHFKKAETDEGTRDYDELVNKPTLNGVEISGDKTSEDYGIECLIPAGGNVGDLIWKTGEGTGWVTPANDLAGDNTRPITASPVNTIVGNIDALLATI